MIDTYLPGDPDAVWSIATWLGDLADDAEQGGTRAAGTANTSPIEGEAGDALNQLMNALTQPAADYARYGRAAAGKIKAYSGQLERTQEALARELEYARAVGLQVDGMVVHPPPPQPTPTTAPAPGSAAEDKWLAYQDKVAGYEAVRDGVATKNTELDEWIRENLDPELANVPGENPFLAIAKGLYGAVPSTVATELWDRQVRQAEGEVERWEKTLRDVEAGNAADPEYHRAVSETRAEAEDARHRAADLDKHPYGRVLKHLGTAGDVIGWATGVNDDPGKFAAGTAGGALGGAVAAALFTGGVAATGGGLALGVAGGVAAEWAYETVVPQHVREAIASGPRGLWDTIF